MEIKNLTKKEVIKLWCMIAIKVNESQNGTKEHKLLESLHDKIFQSANDKISQENILVNHFQKISSYNKK